jgi:hypothetical protein
MPGPNSETLGRFCDDLGRNTMVQYSVGPIITLHGRITAWEYVDRLCNQVHPMVQTLFPNNDAVFRDDIHTAGTVRSWFEEHEGKLQHHPWPTQSPYLNITEPLWSVLETTVRNRFPSPKSLKQIEDVLQEERYKIPRETVQNLYESIRRRIASVLKAKVAQHHINKEMCTVSLAFPLFSSSPRNASCCVNP